MSERLEQLADLVRERSGIVLHGPQRINSLSAALAKLDPPVDAAGALRAARNPTTGEAFVASLLEAVAVHETFFFRQREDLDAIDWPTLLANARADGSEGVRVWVAGCSTGEEAWTLAILASEALGASPPLALLATDLSAAALRRAERGRYGGRSVRQVEAPLRERHFGRDGAHLLVGEPLRRLAAFRRHNLVTDATPVERFDLVLCRNVLIYFDPPTVERVVERLEGTLAPGGMLLLGAADRLCRLPSSRVSRHPAQAGDPARRQAPASPAATTATRRWRAVHRDDEPVVLDGAMATALAAADAGRLDDAIAVTERVLAADPLDADAHFVRGIAHLGSGDAATAAGSLRRALYVDPGFALAAFQLGRAYDALGDEPAARRAYLQALRTLAPGHDRQQRLVADIDLADVAAACGARLAALPRR
ncbi:MAG TPA: CheR family methyltransferase [Conexibacter sp.]|jgi:chemotaxis protein methyltransferase CheR|nr:CheR family methyltransferase [Conexibacter sp.]